MTTGQNYVGGDSHATSNEQTGSSIDSAVQNGTSSGSGEPTSPPSTSNHKPKPAKPTGGLAANIDISVNARYGVSAVDVLIFALTEYQSSRLNTATQEIAEGEYISAADNLSDAQKAQDLLTDLALSLSKLADRNYWASIGEGPRGKDDPHDHFRTRAKHAFGWSPEYIDEYVKNNL